MCGQANLHRQALSPDEECALVKWVERLSCTGHPVRHKFLRELAEEIRKPRVELENCQVSPLGKQWVLHFLRRNPSLISKVAKSIEGVHKEVTEEQLQSWFISFKCAIDEHSILPENVYNMDETGSSLATMTLIEGFNIGVRGQNAWVICGVAEKQAYEVEPGRAEWVMVVECICSDGSANHPLVIFKGETTIQTAWIPPEMDKDWSWTCNTKGWTCDKIGEEWIKRCFEPLTHIKVNGRKHLLICDGHGSHVTAPFIRFCIDHDIVVLLMPPHFSHLCQPLDVSIFSPLKLRMSVELDEIMHYDVPNFKKFEWANCYRIARPIAMTEHNILSAWRGAGLFLLNLRKSLFNLTNGPSLRMNLWQRRLQHHL